MGSYPSVVLVDALTRAGGTPSTLRDEDGLSYIEATDRF